MSVDAATLAALRRAAEAGRDPGAWSRYVTALVAAGQKGRARKAAKSAPLPAASKQHLMTIAEKGSLPDAAPLGDLVGLVRAGKVSDARRLGHRLLQRFPEDAKLLNVLGVMALQGDDPLEGEAYLRRAARADPKNADVVSNLGLALVRQGRSDAAIGVLEALANPPLAARVNLASAYLRADRHEDALALSVEILKEAPRDPETLALRARAHLALDQPEAALESLEPLRARPDFALQDLVADALERGEGRETARAYLRDQTNLPEDTRKRLAVLLGQWGDLEAAREIARGLATDNPKDPTGFRMLGLYGRWSNDDDLIPKMEQGMVDKGLAPSVRGGFGLALGKARMDQGEHDAAFQALLSGNAALREIISYDVERDLARFRDTAQTWNAETLAGLEDDSAPSLTPIFIVGLPRSGSTLIETVLSRHPKVAPLGESPRAFVAVVKQGNAATTDAVKAIRRDVSDFLSPRPPIIALTDKLLTNFQHLGALAAAFPGARFIESRRDLRATALSIFQTELAPAAHPYAMQLDELARYAVGYSRLMNHWASVLGDRLYRADYERLVAHPEDEIPKLVAAAGLPWDDACLGQTTPERRINTFSVAQARQPITTASVARWTRYEAGLKPLIDILKKEGLIDG